MSTFKKDYSNLSLEDKAVLDEYLALSKKNGSRLPNTMSREIMQKKLDIIRRYPFIENYQSIFPNKYLSSINIASSKATYIHKIQKFQSLINKTSTTERDILNFIKQEDAYFLIGSVLKLTDFGHHDRYVFQELPLPPNHQADFLIIGKNSHGFHFIFFELENPYGNIITKEGEFGLTIRKGISQIGDWQSWIEKGMNAFKDVILKSKTNNYDLPKEFYEYDSSRFHYVVIAGRRNDYNEKAQRLVRKSLNNGIRILHYDKIIELSEELIKSSNY